MIALSTKPQHLFEMARVIGVDKLLRTDSLLGRAVQQYFNKIQVYMGS